MKKDGKPMFHILICLVQVWRMDKGLMDVPESCLELAEVESVEIEDSYAQLIDKAKVRFPRGTVVRKTGTTPEESAENGNKVSASLDSRGVLQTTRQGSWVAGSADFSVDSRIRIYLAYTTDPAVAALPKHAPGRGTIFTDKALHRRYFDAVSASGPAFDGFITKCSLDTPIELECESLASVLKKYDSPSIASGVNLTVNDLLAPSGKYKMLAGTGFELHPKTAACKIDIGQVPFSKDLTVADVLTTWAKFKLYSFVQCDWQKGRAYLAVGRPYFTDGAADSVLKINEDYAPALGTEVDFGYDVAENGLTLMNSNKDYLCVQGQRVDDKGNFLNTTLRRNPEWKPGMPEKDKWQFLNKTEMTPKMGRFGKTVMGRSKTAAIKDLGKYTVVPYVSRRIGCTQQQLEKELIEYYESYHMNGVDGTLTLFGGLNLRSGTKVHLTDDYYSRKNGTYFVEEVVTRFGTDGFRQTIKMPYCLSLDSESKEKGNG